MLIIEEKIRVFISSKCGVENENYDLIRAALKQLLESTGMIQTYVFEESSAVSNSTRDEYLSKLEDSHVVLFLIDNEGSITEGVIKEWKHSKEINKRAIYIFFNNPSNPQTFIQEELDGPRGAKYKVVSNLKDFIREGYQSILVDILNVYNNYCRNRLIESPKYSTDPKDSIDNKEQEVYTIVNEKQGVILGKNKIEEFSLTLSYFNKLNEAKYEEVNGVDETSNLDQFAYHLITIMHGESKYDPKIFTLLEDGLHKIHGKELAEIISIRWKAIQDVLENKLNDAILKLNEAYLSSSEKQLPAWFIDDILIDKRNLESKVLAFANEFGEVEAQREIQKRSYTLHYPLLDRIKLNIYQSILKEMYDVNTQSPYTIRFGSGLDNILKNIHHTFVIATCYGSLTHLLSVNELLYRTFYDFSSLYNYYPWKYLSLKFCILDVDLKSLEKAYSRNRGILESCSFEKIKELYSLSDAIPQTLEKYSLKIKLMELLGYYFSDEDYVNIQAEMFDIFDSWLGSSPLYIPLSPAISSCLKANIKRVDHQLVVMKSLTLFNKRHYRFFDDFFKVLVDINWEQIEPETFNQVVELISELIKKPELRYNCSILSNLVLNMRLKCRQLVSWDNLVRDHWPSFYKSEYELEVSERTPQNDEKYLLSCLEDIRVRNENQGKEGRYFTFGNNPFQTMRNILKHSDLVLDANKVFYPVIHSMVNVLLNPKQTTEEKVECIKFIIFFKNFCTKQQIPNSFWDEFKYEITKHKDKLYSSVDDGFANQMTKFTLRTNILFLDGVLGEINKTEFFELISMHYAANAYDNIQLMRVVELYLEFSSCSYIPSDPIYSTLLQLILSQINHSNFENKLFAIKCLTNFIESEYSDVVIKSISYHIDDADYRLKLWIIEGIKDKKSFEIEGLLEKLISDNNYLVRIAAKNALTLKLDVN
ncbi:hypothetical protein D3C76_569430 [compost metagenome]